MLETVTVGDTMRFSIDGKPGGFDDLKFWNAELAN